MTNRLRRRLRRREVATGQEDIQIPVSPGSKEWSGGSCSMEHKNPSYV